jgi:hypothetical protein
MILLPDYTDLRVITLIFNNKSNLCNPGATRRLISVIFFIAYH